MVDRLVLLCFVLLTSVPFAAGQVAELPPPVAPGLGKGAVITNDVTGAKSAASEAELMARARKDVERARLNQNALSWQLERAKAGSATAMRSIGMRFLKGDGLPKDEKQAREWLTKGADGGDSAAKKELARMDAAATAKKDLTKQ